MDKAAVVFLCEEQSHTNFYMNMENALVEQGYICIYIALDLSQYFFLKSKEKKIIYLLKKADINISTEAVHTAKEVVEHTLSAEDAVTLYKAVYKCCSQITDKYSVRLFIGSQGVRVAELALREYAKVNGYDVVFSELANLPQKTFWDIKGSNAVSFLYENIAILDKNQVPDEEYEIWRKNYLEANFKNHIVKQSVNKQVMNFKYGVLSMFGSYFTGVKNKYWNFLERAKKIYYSKAVNIQYDEVDLEKESYFFFPMQVASDSQIILNSDIGLLDAVHMVINMASDAGKKLVIKLHPAEKDARVVKELLKLKRQYRFYIVNDNTFSVISNADKVITINSTVALESMIIGKPVEILGRSYYKEFTHERLKSYILRYLVDLDYFSNKPFTVEEMKQFYDRFINKG